LKVYWPGSSSTLVLVWLTLFELLDIFDVANSTSSLYIERKTKSWKKIIKTFSKIFQDTILKPGKTNRPCNMPKDMTRKSIWIWNMKKIFDMLLDRNIKAYFCKTLKNIGREISKYDDSKYCRNTTLKRFTCKKIWALFLNERLSTWITGVPKELKLDLGG